MTLTSEYITKNNPIYSGILKKTHHWKGYELYELNNSLFFLRREYFFLSALPTENLHIYSKDNRLYAYFPKNNLGTEVSKQDFIASELKEPFKGFELGKKYHLKNNQIWEQISSTYANARSSGKILIYQNRFMQVDNWNDLVEVRLLD